MLMSRSRRLETLCHSTRRPSGVAAPPRGRRTAPRISPGASAVLRYPVKKASSGSSRAPRSERSSTRASSARSSGALSPMGEAVTRLPASVARLRICREAKTWSISSKAGCSPASASSTAVSVAAPPMRHSPPTTATARSSATPSVEIEQGVDLRLLVDEHADLGGAAHQLGLGVEHPQAQQLVERGGPEEGLPGGLVGEPLHRLRGLLQELRERVAAARLTARERVHHGLADGRVAGAAAEVAAELIGDLRRRGHLVPVERLDHRHGEPRRAVAALRAVALDHGRLHRVQRLPVGDALHGDDLAPGHHRQQRDAAIDGAQDALAVRVGLDQRHRAGAAVALGAALLAPGEAGGAEVVEERAVGRLALDRAGPSVEGEGEAIVQRRLRKRLARASAEPTRALASSSGMCSRWQSASMKAFSVWSCVPST